MRVMINAGHDIEYDCGAVNTNYELTEAEVARDISERVVKLLEERGIETMFIQSDNLTGENPALPCVVDEANQNDCDLFVSIHCNAFNKKARGTECLYFPTSPKSKMAASYIQQRICIELDTLNRGTKERSDLAVLKYTTMPAVLVETAFIDNDADAYKLMQHPDWFAVAISRGIIDYAKRYGYVS